MPQAEKPTTAQKPAITPLTVSAAKAGRMIGVNRKMALEMVHSGELPARILRKRIRVLTSDVEKFVASLPKLEVAS